MTFLDESKLPHYQKSRGIFTPPPPPHTSPWLRHRVARKNINKRVYSKSLACSLQAIDKKQSIARCKHTVKATCLDGQTTFYVLQYNRPMDDTFRIVDNTNFISLCLIQIENTNYFTKQHSKL